MATAYHSAGTPRAVLINADGRIESPVAQGAEALGELVARVVSRTVLLAAAPGSGNGAAVTL